VEYLPSRLRTNVSPLGPILVRFALDSQVLAVTTDRALYRFDVFAYQSRTGSTSAETVSVSDLTPFA
jgi:hypothetical protein